MNTGRQTRGELLNERVHFVCYIQRVAFGLAIHVEKHRRFTIRGNDGVHRRDRGCDFCDVAKAKGNAGWRVLHNDLPDLLRGADLTADQAQHQLMIAFDQTRRVNQIRPADGVQNIGDGDTCGEKPRGIRRYLKFGNAAALDDDRCNAIQPVEAWL